MSFSAVVKLGVAPLLPIESFAVGVPCPSSVPSFPFPTKAILARNTAAGQSRPARKNCVHACLQACTPTCMPVCLHSCARARYEINKKRTSKRLKLSLRKR
eukprot:4009941-Lingulodinium_polyedra.AAC.1